MFPMPDITVTSREEDAASRSVQVIVPVERVKAAESKVVRTYASRLRLPGFRKGRAPEAMVRKRLHKEIRQYVLEDLIRAGWEEARATGEIQPAGDPTVRNLKFEDDSPLEFELLVPIKPVIDLRRTGGFQVSRRVEQVTEDQVSERLFALREQHAQWVPVMGERPSPGQLVVVNIRALDDDNTETGRPSTLVLGSGNAPAAIEEAIMALLPGETGIAEDRYPEDHPDAELRGLARRLELVLQEVKRQELPELDDAFAASVGGFENVAALQSAVQEDLEAAARSEADAKIREALLDQLVEANGIPTPPSMVHRFVLRLAEAYGLQPEQMESFAGQFHGVAERQVRRSLVLDTLAEREKLAATEAEIDARISRIAEHRGVSPGQVYAALEQEKRLGELELSVTEEKVWNWLIQQSTITEE